MKAGISIHDLQEMYRWSYIRNEEDTDQGVNADPLRQEGGAAPTLWTWATADSLEGQLPASQVTLRKQGVHMLCLVFGLYITKPTVKEYNFGLWLVTFGVSFQPRVTETFRKFF